MQSVETAAGGLRGILNGLLQVEGVTAALVAGRDGFVIESTAVNPIDTDSVGAIAVSSLTAAEAMGEVLQLGAMGSVLIEYERGPVAVVPAGSDAVLAVVANQSANLGRVRVEMRKVRQAVANQL